jgi:hypothetical protein
MLDYNGVLRLDGMTWHNQNVLTESSVICCIAITYLDKLLFISMSCIVTKKTFECAVVIRLAARIVSNKLEYSKQNLF